MTRAYFPKTDCYYEEWEHVPEVGAEELVGLGDDCIWVYIDQVVHDGSYGEHRFYTVFLSDRDGGEVTDIQVYVKEEDCV